MSVVMMEAAVDGAANLTAYARAVATPAPAPDPLPPGVSIRAHIADYTPARDGAVPAAP
jgi:hypothetical protein